MGNPYYVTPKQEQALPKDHYKIEAQKFLASVRRIGSNRRVLVARTA